jgi:myo-inositol catabolism protein IolS
LSGTLDASDGGSRAVEHRPFGRTGLEVSAVGFGCWEVGGGYGDVEQAEFARAVDRALDLGVNCFDTAEGYGMGASERALGQALGPRRDEAIIVTKFGMNYRDKPNLRDSSRERVFASIDKSLQNLGTDWVDVYLVHWPDRLTPFEETMEALEKVVSDGKVRFVGLSNFKLEEIQRCMRTRRIDVVQYGWNMFDRRMQREILPYCQEHGIGYMAYGSLCFGLLTGTFTEDMDFGAADWRSRRGKMGSIKMFEALFGPETFPRNVRAVEELKGIAARHGKSLPQLALRWAISHPAISTALVGCRNVAEVEDNVGAVGWSISDDDLAAIDTVFARHGIDTTPEFWIEED